jgi:hypothetical protein
MVIVRPKLEKFDIGRWRRRRDHNRHVHAGDQGLPRATAHRPKLQPSSAVAAATAADIGYGLGL